MYKKCNFCGRFYNQQKSERMCKECKCQYEIAFERIQTNPTLKNICKRLVFR